MQGRQRSKIDDDLLTARAQAGDGIAFSALVERHYVRVVVAAEIVAGNLADAEICAQEAFARACGRLGEMARPADFLRAVYEAALKRALVRRRRRPGERALVRRRAALALREYGGFAYREIAAMLGLSVVATRRLLVAARQEACDPVHGARSPSAARAWRHG